MKLLDKLMKPATTPTPEPVDSTRDELEAEKATRHQEHDRTDRLARMLNDYAQQDAMRQ